ncbi:MAG: hypothetical protein HZC10_06285 [Nitrospirae bacterium]|nr:hypothetical protein [Nitrospirota bacterium]
MNDHTIIDKLYQDNTELIKFLEKQGEISMLSNIDDQFRKVLVLCVSSYFESIIKDTLIDFAKKQSQNAEALVEFLKNKAIERQYHTYFQWDSANCNAFFGLFGKNFKEYINSETNSNDEFTMSVKAFIELGGIRNKLIHNNLTTFYLEKTSEEIYSLYKSALVFIDTFRQKLYLYSDKR